MRCLVFGWLCLFGCKDSSFVAPSVVAPASRSAVAPVSQAAVVVSKPKPEKRLLFDPRLPHERRVAPDGEKLLTTLFPERLKPNPQCSWGRGAVGINPKIEAFVRGSFTAPGREQIAYLIDLDECDAGMTRVGLLTTFRWFITEGGVVISSNDTDFHANNAWAVDVNQDGIDEIVAARAGLMRDGTGTTISLYVVREGKLTIVESFARELALSNECSSQDNPSLRVIVYYFIPAEPGELPEIIKEELPDTCAMPKKVAPNPKFQKR